MKINFSLKSLKATKKFSRQAIVPDFLDTQINLVKTKILIVGAGGLGCPVSLYLSQSGAHIKIIDFDRIELSNLPRQTLFNEKDINSFKSEIIGKKLQIDFSIEKVCRENVENLIRDFDLIVDCTDSMSCRYILNDSCKLNQKRFLCASVLGWEGQVYSFKKKGACYRCLYPKPRKVISNCADSGVIGSMCGVIGSLLSNEVMKAVGDEDYDNYLYFNGKSNEILKMEMKPSNKSCTVCSTQTYGEIFEASCSLKKQKVDENQEIEEIDWQEFEKNHKKYFILDVRGDILFRYFCLENSINIFVNDLLKKSKDELIEILPEDQLILVICRRGISARDAALFLKNIGFKAVVLKGGFMSKDL